MDKGEMGPDVMIGQTPEIQPCLASGTETQLQHHSSSLLSSTSSTPKYLINRPFNPSVQFSRPIKPHDRASKRLSNRGLELDASSYDSSEVAEILSKQSNQAATMSRAVIDAWKLTKDNQSKYNPRSSQGYLVRCCYST